MADNKHCPDHVKFAEALVRIEMDTRFIKERMTEKKSDTKWLGTFLIAFIGFLMSILNSMK